MKASDVLPVTMFCLFVCFASLSTLDTPSWCHPLMFAPAPEISPRTMYMYNLYMYDVQTYKAKLPVQKLISHIKELSSHTDNYPPYKPISFPYRKLTILSNYLSVHKLLEFVILTTRTPKPKKINILWGL